MLYKALAREFQVPWIEGGMSIALLNSPFHMELFTQV